MSAPERDVDLSSGEGESRAESGESEPSSPKRGLERRTPRRGAARQGMDWLSRWFGGSRSAIKSADGLRGVLFDALAEEQTAAYGFSASEKAMLRSILRFRDVRVEDVMVPRAEVEAVEITIPLSELLGRFENSGHTRMPVYLETLDDPKGMIHIRDLVSFLTKSARLRRPRRKRKSGEAEDSGDSNALAEDSAASASAGGDSRTARKSAVPGFDLGKLDFSASLDSIKLTRPVLFAPPSMLASELMARMQASRIQMALVIDEYGGTEGLICLEDILESIVGDIEDEHDEDEGDLILDQGGGVFRIDARASIEDFRTVAGKDLKIPENGEEIETVGGLVFLLCGHVPVRGELVEGPGYEFRVLEADARRIKRVEFMRSEAKLSPSSSRREARASGGKSVSGSGEANQSTLRTRSSPPDSSAPPNQSNHSESPSSPSESNRSSSPSESG